MKVQPSRWASVLLATILGAVSAGATSCSERPTEEACYFVDDAADYVGPQYNEWCEYELGDVTPLLEEHCPAGECIDYFITCDDVPIDHVCETCPADALDDKVLAALSAEYEVRCPDGPREVIDFERGCVYEKSIPTSTDTKRCCYTAIVVGECSLMEM